MFIMFIKLVLTQFLYCDFFQNEHVQIHVSIISVFHLMNSFIFQYNQTRKPPYLCTLPIHVLLSSRIMLKYKTCAILHLFNSFVNYGGCTPSSCLHGPLRFLLHVNNKSADQTAHTRSLISVFLIRSLEIILAELDMCKILIF